jgi:hypothetical protein
MIHDFPDAVGFFFRRRRPPPWGWCGLSFFFVEPHGLPLFFADPLDITIWAKGNCSQVMATRLWYNMRQMNDKLKFALKAWPVIAAATIGLCFLTQGVAKLFGIDLPDQHQVEALR